MASLTQSARHYPNAKSPLKMSRRDWKEILLRVKNEISDDRISAIAAANAYYILFAIFPLLISIVSLYGLFADPIDVEKQFNTLAEFVPLDAAAVIRDQLRSIVENSNTTLGFGAVLSLLATIWAASAGTRFVMEAMNIAYDETEKRGFIRFYWEALLLTISAVFTATVMIFLLAGLPAILNFVGLGSFAETLLLVLRWPILALIIIVALSVMNRYAPSRSQPKWRWISPGSLLSTFLILLASAGFAFYVEKFGSYNKTYGSIAGVIVLLFWLYIVSYAILLGAELNSEIEHQTRADTTVGPEKPMGQRGAVMADTLPGPDPAETNAQAAPRPSKGASFDERAVPSPS